MPPAATSSLDNHQSETVADGALLCSDSSVVPVGHARTHTHACTLSPQKYAVLCQGSLQFHSTQQNVFINISLMVDMYTHTHTHKMHCGERSLHYQQVLSPVPSGW